MLDKRNKENMVVYDNRRTVLVREELSTVIGLNNEGNEDDMAVFDDGDRRPEVG
jgi:hypothetical protein